MGYTTDFYGEFDLDRALKPEHEEYLKAFNYTRRVRRNAKEAATLDDPVRIAAGLPIGADGGYYVGSATDGNFGQEKDSSVTDFNSPPESQPGLWCHWESSNEGSIIQWDYGEKFYYYVEWLEYLVEHFLKRWGYVVNGAVEWKGEESDDLGIIVVIDNVIESKCGIVVYE